jgi:hypothetical protein
MLRIPCGLQVIVVTIQTPCDAMHFVPVCCTYCESYSFWFRNAASILQCTGFFDSERCRITTQFSDMTDMIPNHADVSFALLQDFWDSKFHAMNWCCMMPCSSQVLAAKCCNTEQFCANILRLRNSNTAWPKYCIQMLLRRDAYIQGCFYTRVLLHRDAFHKDVLLHTDNDTYRCFNSEMLLHAATQALSRSDAFTQRSTDTLVLLHADAFTQQCFYRGVLLHARAFTQGFFWHKLAFTHRRLII